MNHRSLKPIPLMLGTAMVFGGAAAHASEFQVLDLASGYQIAAAGDGKMAEGSCGENMNAMMKDANKDGKLSMEEHRAYWDEQYGKRDSSDRKMSADEHRAHWDEQFATTDSNKDGFVTTAEMQAAMGHEKGMEGSCGEKK